MMSLPSALLAFATFKTLFSAFSNSQAAFFSKPFTDVENVFVQSLAVAVGTGPLAFGFIGVIPAMEKFLTPKEAGILPSDTNGKNLPIDEKHSRLSFSVSQLILWSSALSLFGVFFAVLLRRQIIVKEKLPFPSGSATATMIAVLHHKEISPIHFDSSSNSSRDLELDSQTSMPEPQRLNTPTNAETIYNESNEYNEDQVEIDPIRTTRTFTTPTNTIKLENLSDKTYHENIRILLISFAISSGYSVVSYFFPVLKNIPLFGKNLAKNYLWTFQPSPAYFGQGVIMGLPTVASMFLGAILGWAILGPMAKHKGWATGPVDDWQTGAQGWILWISLVIMVVDSVVSFFSISTISIYKLIRRRNGSDNNKSNRKGYLPVSNNNNNAQNLETSSFEDNEEFEDEEPDASKKNLVPLKVALIGLVISCIYCVIALKFTFLLPLQMNNNNNSANSTTTSPSSNNISPAIYSQQNAVASSHLDVLTNSLISLKPKSVFTRETSPISYQFDIPIYPIVLAVLLALLLAILGVRALGETDLNPVSGIGKISQLIFALLIPSSTATPPTGPHNTIKHPGSILINLIAGAVTEAGAQQAGDLMQDLKTGHLVGASPRSQFVAQVVGSLWSILLSSVVYKLYDYVYQLPNSEKNFRIPTAVVWIDCARLVVGEGLPNHVDGFLWAFGILFSIFAGIKVLSLNYNTDSKRKTEISLKNNNNDNNNKNNNFDDGVDSAKSSIKSNSVNNNIIITESPTDNSFATPWDGSNKSVEELENSFKDSFDKAREEEDKIETGRTGSLQNFNLKQESIEPTTTITTAKDEESPLLDFGHEQQKRDKGKGKSKYNKKSLSTEEISDNPDNIANSNKDNGDNNNLSFAKALTAKYPKKDQNKLQEHGNVEINKDRLNSFDEIDEFSSLRHQHQQQQEENKPPPPPPSFVEPKTLLQKILAMLKPITIWILVHGRHLPSGVAVGIGIYNTPSFTLARLLGGLFATYWSHLHAIEKKGSSNSSDNGKNNTNYKYTMIKLVVLSSGLVLGEGCFSIVALIMTSLGIPHF